MAEDRKTKDHGRDESVPTYSAGGGGAQQNVTKAATPPSHSQKSQIAQYFKSQGRQPNDEIWSVNGLSLKLSDLE